MLTDIWSFNEANGMQNEDVLQRGEVSNILRTIKIRKADWIGHIWCRDYLPNHVTEGKIEGMIEVTGR